MSIRCALGFHDDKPILKKPGKLFKQGENWEASAIMVLYQCRRCGRKTAKGYASTIQVPINPEWFEGTVGSDQEDKAKMSGVAVEYVREQNGKS